MFGKASSHIKTSTICKIHHSSKKYQFRKICGTMTKPLLCEVMLSFLIKFLTNYVTKQSSKYKHHSNWRCQNVCIDLFGGVKEGA